VLVDDRFQRTLLAKGGGEFSPQCIEVAFALFLLFALALNQAADFLDSCAEGRGCLRD